MRHLLLVGLLLTTTARPHDALADSEPCFELEASAWRAGRVGLCACGAAGSITVLESRQGDLAAGEAVSVAEASRHPGTRVVLFLDGKRGAWRAATSLGGMEDSIVWIDCQETFAKVSQGR